MFWLRARRLAGGGVTGSRDAGRLAAAGRGGGVGAMAASLCTPRVERSGI